MLGYADIVDSAGMTPIVLEHPFMTGEQRLALDSPS